MNFELTTIHRMIVEASHTPISAINPILYLDKLNVEKRRIINVLEDYALKYRDKAATEELPEFIKLHLSTLTEFEQHLKTIEDPFQSFLKIVIKELKFYLTIQFNVLLNVGTTELVLQCNDQQMGSVISTLIKLNVLEPKPAISIPENGIRLLPTAPNGQGKADQKCKVSIMRQLFAFRRKRR
jgi:hypothetical protein